MSVRVWSLHPVYYLLALAVLLFAFFQITPPPGNFPPQAWKILGLAVLMILFWLAEVIPFAITALLPLIILPLLGVADFKEVAVFYSHPVILLFLGGFLIATALEKTALHRRFALFIIRYTGRSYSGVLLGFIIATAFMSMWISNTATTLMMVAIAAPSVNYLFPEDTNPNEKNRFATLLLLSIAYAANIGGITTIIGTPPNAVLYALMSSQHNIELGFVEWIVYASPVTLVMLSILYLTYRRKITGLDRSEMSGQIRQNIGKTLQQMGPLNKAQTVVAVVFVSTVLLWLLREPINILVGAKILDDPMIAVFGGVLPFIIPLNRRKPEFAVTWKDTHNLPWNILLLFGGGLSLAYGMEVTGLINWAALEIVDFAGNNAILLLILLPALMLFMTELMGNVAIISVFLPVTFQIGSLLGLPVQFFAFPITIASSFAFMLPIATPPNAIVYGLGYFKVAEMARRGAWLNLFGIIVIVLYNYIFFFILGQYR